VNPRHLTKGVVAILALTALSGSYSLSAATITTSLVIAPLYEPLPSPPFMPLVQSVEEAPAPVLLVAPSFAEPALYILGTEVRAYAITCVRSGGNFYYHGGSICLHLTT
jgi:hypothetical protein